MDLESYSTFAMDPVLRTNGSMMNDDDDGKRVEKYSDADSVRSEVAIPLPWNDPEYVRFVRALQGGNNNVSTDYGDSSGSQDLLPPSEIYQSLMTRERRALDTVDRVVNDARKTELRSARLLDLPFNDLLRLSAKTLQAVMEDLVNAKDASDVMEALTQGDRKIFIGAILVFIAIVAAIIKSIS